MTVRPRRRPAAVAAGVVAALALVACTPDGGGPDGGGPDDGASDPGARSAPATAGEAAEGTGPADDTGAADADPADYAARLVARTQEVRDEAGVPRLEESACAQDAARARAAALVGAPLEHAPLDDVVATCTPPGGTAAENLSRAAAGPADVVDAWMGSHGHRANLLDPELTAVGVACAPDPGEGDGALVCAQVFLG